MATADNKPFDVDKLAVALSYERQTDQAPKVAAKGKGFMAEQIIELAREHGIEIREDRDLVTLLSKVDIGTPIPMEAYAAVAEILSYIYRVNGQMKGNP
ncbi:MAG: EscU/YscU/HrcU family type III secretion system export apparatus switch protein [Rickettsiales bacterium]|nr:EscU/YscU/HrcU family type III secretion system export apparatus switch protein [Rickettsiales bacterium]